MQCFESYAIRLKLFTALQEFVTELDYDELGLDDLIQDFDVQSFPELDVLISEGLAHMNITDTMAA